MTVLLEAERFTHPDTTGNIETPIPLQEGTENSR